MTDLRARIAEALLDCHMTSKTIPIDVYEIVDTVLSLDRIAIVELPEPSMGPNFDFDDGYVFVDDGEIVGKHGTEFGPPDRVRRFAAALLAAAKTAEEQK